MKISQHFDNESNNSNSKNSSDSYRLFANRITSEKQNQKQDQVNSAVLDIASPQLDDSRDSSIGNINNITKILTTTNNQQIKFTYNNEGKVVASVLSDNGQELSAKLIKPEDIPQVLVNVKDQASFMGLLDNAYIRTSILSNGDIKVYVNQRGLGGGKGDRDLPGWKKLLTDIKEKQQQELGSGSSASSSSSNTNKVNKVNKVGLKKVFISYAWEDQSTEAGKIENAKLQRFLENLRDDLQLAGLSVFLDIGDMTGHMKTTMQQNLQSGDVIITINTPRFKTRVEEVAKTNVGFEYELTLNKALTIPYGIIPLHYSGNFNESFPDALKQYLIRNCQDNEKYADSLVATQRPLGIIPAIYSIDGDDDLEYKKLIQDWRYEKLSKLPEANPEFTGRGELLDKISTSLQDGHGVINQKQTISGLGGVGKTQLALAYSHKYGDKYTMKRWLNTEGSGIKLEFEQMASELGIESEGMSATELSSAVYRKLAEIDTWLLVFDNADDYAAIKEYLPNNQTIKPGQHILITTRSQQWKRCISLDEFSSSEALEYISKEIPKATQDQAKQLAYTVGNLPLALSQAVAYIKENTISVTKYLGLYQSKGIELLQVSDKNKVEGAQDYPHSVMNTWAISMDKVKAESKLAAKILLACAYLSPNDIPSALFENVQSFKGQIKIDEALNILKNYSLVKPAALEDNIQIHRLVQTVIKYKHVQDGENPEKILLLMQKALNNYYPHEKQTVADYNKAKLLLPHVESLIGELEPFNKIEQCKNNLGAMAQSHLLMIAGDIFDIQGDARSELKVQEQALQMRLALYQGNHPDVASSLNNVGTAYKMLGEVKKSLGYLEQALQMTQNLYTGDHPNVASSLNNVGSAYQTLGDIKKGLGYFEQALQMRQKLHQGNHPDVATCLNNVGTAYQTLGDFKESLGYFEQALQMKQLLYSGDLN